jgi:hypothetical protein
MRNTSLLLAALLTAAFAFAQTIPPISAFDHQLIDQQKQLLQAIEAKNVSLVDHAIAGDFEGIGSNGDPYDRSEIIDSAQDPAAKTLRSYEFHVIKLTADSAIVTYNLIVPGEHPRYRHMADTWAKINGVWKLKFRQFTPNLWSANDPD